MAGQLNDGKMVLISDRQLKRVAGKKQRRRRGRLRSTLTNRSSALCAAPMAFDSNDCSPRASARRRVSHLEHHAENELGSSGKIVFPFRSAVVASDRAANYQPIATILYTSRMMMETAAIQMVML